MAGTTRLELATSAVTALRELVLQQLTRSIAMAMVGLSELFVLHTLRVAIP
jgi:hypothetical protein